MLTQFAPNIWLADGPTIKAAMGFHYPTRAVIVRLETGGLWIWSPVELTAELKAKVDALGPVTHLIAPNTLHHTYIAPWQTAYPEALLYGPEGLANKRPDLRFSGVLQGEAPPDWQGEIDQFLFHNKLMTEVVFYHRASQTLIVTDLIQSLPRDWYRGWRKMVARMDLMCEPGGTMPRKFRLGFKDKAATRAAWHRVRDWAPERLIMAHGAPVETQVPALLDKAFGWLD